MYFSDKMTYPETLQTLFSVVEGKSKAGGFLIPERSDAP